MITAETLSHWLITMESLVFLRGIQQDRSIQKLIQTCEILIPLLATDQKTIDSSLLPQSVPLSQKRLIARTWAEFLDSLASSREAALLSTTLEALLSDLILQDENPLTLALERDSFQNVPVHFRSLAVAELKRLEQLAQLNLKLLSETVAALTGIESLPWAHATKTTHSLTPTVSPVAPTHNLSPGSGRSWPADFEALAEYIHTHGAGILGQHHAFIWQHKQFRGQAQSSHHGLYSVLNADMVALEDLSGYEAQRSVVLENTRRFVEGKSANNMLLYGDRGTGKSATVKAVCRAFADRGLKLIEVRKRDLLHFEDIAETLSGRGLKFVLFIDDLSFEETDDTFTGLKALLEGSLERRPGNVVIYATSNRRHLVKERFSDRPTAAQAAEALTTGDVRAFDTMQEQLSLADRFGVTVVFTAPNQEEYLTIAEAIAERRGILGPETDRERFRQNALRWERWFNGRSPRTAQQYVDWLAGGELFPWE